MKNISVVYFIHREQTQSYIQHPKRSKRHPPKTTSRVPHTLERANAFVLLPKTNTTRMMSYKPHLPELVSDLKSNPSLIHEHEFLELKRVLETQFASTFPPKSNTNTTTPKNEDVEEDVDIKIEDPDIVGPELEPVDPPLISAQEEGEELSETDMNSVRI